MTPRKRPRVRARLTQEQSDKLRFLQERLPRSYRLVGLISLALDRLIAEEFERHGLRVKWEARRRTLEVSR